MRLKIEVEEVLMTTENSVSKEGFNTLLDDRMEELFGTPDIGIIIWNGAYSPGHFWFMEWLYERGHRKGDFLYYIVWPDEDVNEVYGDYTKTVWSEMIDGALVTRQETFIGEIGDRIQATWDQMIGYGRASLFNCYDYDALYLLANALDTAIFRGDDFEDPDRLHTIIKE